MTREPGFYWLRDNGEWTPGQWEAGSWWIPGSDLRWQDADFEEIGAPISEPPPREATWEDIFMPWIDCKVPQPQPFLIVDNNIRRYKFMLMGGEDIRHGDLVVLDKDVGLLRKARPEDALQRFVVAPNALITSSYIEMDMP